MRLAELCEDSDKMRREVERRKYVEDVVVKTFLEVLKDFGFPTTGKPWYDNPHLNTAMVLSWHYSRDEDPEMMSTWLAIRSESKFDLGSLIDDESPEHAALTKKLKDRRGSTMGQRMAFEIIKRLTEKEKLFLGYSEGTSGQGETRESLLSIKGKRPHDIAVNSKDQRVHLFFDFKGLA